jgi:hypothetical protein
MTTRPTRQAAPETSRARLTYLELEGGAIHVLR